MAIPTADITGVVLAGGRGLRVRGHDKGLLEHRGRPLAAHSLDALWRQVGPLLVSANRNLDRYAALGVPVVTDSLPGFHGPLAGMLAGLRHAATEWVLFVPCDALCLPTDLARRLSAATERNAPAAYATAGADGLYTCCLLKGTLAGPLERFLESGRRSVREFLESCGAVAVAFVDWPAEVRNVNTLEQLAQAPGYGIRGQA